MNLPTTLTQFIWHFIKKQKGYFIAMQLLAFAWSLDNTAWPYALKMLIDKIIHFTGSTSGIWHYLTPVLIVWASLWLTIELMFRAFDFITIKAFPQLESSIRMSIFDYVSNHSYEFFANHFAGNVSNKISDMVTSATQIVQLTMTLFLPALLALMIAGAIFYSVNHFFALLLVGWVVLHIGICLFGSKKCARLSKVHSSARSVLTGKIVDSFTNIINVKLFAKQRYEYAYINTYQADERKKNQQTLFSISITKIALSFSAIIFPGLLMTWYIIYSWQHKIIGVGDVVLIFNTTWNIQLLAWYAGLELPNLFKHIGTCQQALTIIKAKHDISNKPGAKTLTINNGSITFAEVNFHYIKENAVFDKLSLTIEAGSKVRLVGFSGSGKSTFVNLIMRFFEIQSGQICIDATDIRDVTLESLRSQISMIPQNPSLFHRSLQENICYGKVDATTTEILAASKHAHCHEFINALPQAYDSLVGERGIKLSGGQRQRVAIARAILENAPILVLDEATSALDSVTEKHIQDALHYLMKDRTTIVIAHRLSTLSEMDRILVFDQGRVIEDGTHESLLKQGRHYAEMWRMQAGGFLPDAPKDVQSN